ncbi:MAG: HlyD family secretion protein, partial [Dolichospermum sp.]
VKNEIYETDINKVKLGQIATIKADGIVEGITGIVDEIGLEISSKNVLSTDPVADADARVVEVKIKLNPQDSIKVSRLTNLQVNVIINPGKTDN